MNLYIFCSDMNGMEKTVTELQGMFKIADDIITENLNHVMMAQTEKKKRKRWTRQRQGKVVR
jgi:hypothetical protein